jgi:hypothetical protein
MEANDNPIPSFEEILADPDIAALLDFEPVPRKIRQPGEWTPELQREFIARLAVSGSPGKASEEMGKDRGGARKLYKAAGGESFRAAWDAAIDLAVERDAERMACEALPPGTIPPTLAHRRKDAPPPDRTGQVLNEYGEWEDEASLQRRAAAARDSISNTLLNARRLDLAEICDCPGKRAAFEILTELPIDWDRAARLQPQPDEPWRNPNMRNPDMLLTAENGWMGDMAHGRDKKQELQEALNRHRIENGQEPVDWGGSE